MGQEVSRGPPAPKITIPDMIARLHQIHHRVKTEPEFRELLRFSTENPLDKDPNHEFQGSNEEFEFMIGCLEQLSDKVQNESKMKQELEKLVTIQNGSSNDLKLLNEQITMIVEYNEKHIDELNRHHDEEMAHMRENLKFNNQRIMDLERQLEERMGKADSQPSQSLPTTSSSDSKAELYEKLQKKQQKLREFEEFICETNRKTLQTAVEFFKEDAGELEDLHQKIQVLEAKLAEKHGEMESNMRKVEEKPVSDEEFRQIRRNVHNRLKENGISVELSILTIKKTENRAVADEDEWFETAMHWIEENRIKRDRHDFSLYSKDPEGNIPLKKTPSTVCLDNIQCGDFKSTQVLYSQGIEAAQLMICLTGAKYEAKKRELGDDPLKEVEKLYLRWVEGAVRHYHNQYNFSEERLAEIFEMAWKTMGLEPEKPEKPGSEPERPKNVPQLNLKEIDRETESPGTSNSQENEPEKPEPEPVTPSTSPSSDWSRISEAESDEDE